MTDKIERYAEFSFIHRQNRTIANDVPTELQDIDLRQGYAIQDKLVNKLLGLWRGEIIGYKIGCTSIAAQQLLHTDAPAYGQLFSAQHYRSPVALNAADFTMLVIEPEFAFTLKEDVVGSVHDAASILPFVQDVIPSIEIVHHRLGGWDCFNAPKLVADNAIHGAWISGTSFADVAALDLPKHKVTLYADDVEVSVGSGEVVLGSPLTALAWLANELPQYGHQLKAGQIVTTGVCMAVYTAQVGQRIVADFGSLGTVEVVF